MAILKSKGTVRTNDKWIKTRVDKVILGHLMSAGFVVDVSALGQLFIGLSIRRCAEIAYRRDGILFRKNRATRSTTLGSPYCLRRRFYSFHGFFEHRAQAPVGLHRRIACYRLVAVARGGEFKGVGKALHNVPRGVCSGFSVLVVLTLTSARRLQVPNCTLRNVAVWSKANTARMGSALTIKQLIHLAA